MNSTTSYFQEGLNGVVALTIDGYFFVNSDGLGLLTMDGCLGKI